MPIVTHVRKEASADLNHHHIASVKSSAGMVYSRAEVVQGLDKGEEWATQAKSGHSARIEKIRFCPAPGCLVTPCIRTHRDAFADDNLDNLPLF